MTYFRITCQLSFKKPKRHLFLLCLLCGVVDGAKQSRSSDTPGPACVVRDLDVLILSDMNKIAKIEGKGGKNLGKAMTSAFHALLANLCPH